MRFVLGMLAVLVATAPAAAISRYNAWTMSCAKAQGLVRAEGAVILRFRSNFNPSIPRYGRFVANQSYCSVGELAEITSIPTADAKSCPVLECHQVEDYDEFDDLWRRR
jgi:hypothetical protein